VLREGVGVAELPSGTVTFLFTDLEGSTRLWEQFPDVMQFALGRHDAILRAAVDRFGGAIVKGTGDGMHGVFVTAQAAVSAAVAMQQGIADEDFGGFGQLVEFGLGCIRDRGDS
jgi:class 3 adenylate cyclase